MSSPSAQRLLAKLLQERANVPAFDIAIANAALATFGNTYFVDSVSGSDAAAGTSLATAFKTITKAVTTAAAGDTIFLRGSFTEEVTVDKEGLRLIGIGVSPRQTQWTADADGVCLEIAAGSVLVQNIYFRPPAYTADRGACAIKLNGAAYARILGNRFQGKTGSQAAIYSPVANSDNVVIQGNDFQYLNTATYGAAIVGVEAGGLSYSAWQIVDNIFASCVTAINLCGRVCVVTGNSIAEAGINPAGAVATILSLGIDLSGTNSGGNQVWGNQLGGTYNATLYKVGASGDQWAGNYNVLTGGVTAANPA